jgi:hypothetical protein
MRSIWIYGVSRRLVGMLVFSVVTLSSIHAQSDEDEDLWEFEERRGFSFGLNLGVYFGNKASASFFNGTCFYELNDTQAQCYDIESRLFLGQTEVQVQNLLNVESFTIPYDAAPGNMRYNPGMLVGFRIAYRFNTENAICLDANYASLKAADKFTLRTNLLPENGQGAEDLRLYNIIGEEDRLLLSLGYRTAMVINEESNWFFEAGGTFTGTKLNRNYLEIEGTTFDLWVGFIGPNNFNGPNSSLTATGLGYYGGTGIEFFFADKYEAQLGFRLSKDHIKMGDFDQKLWNSALFFTVGI